MSTLSTGSLSLSRSDEYYDQLNEERNSKEIQIERGLGGDEELNERGNEISRNSRAHYFLKLVQTVILRPITCTATLLYRTIKLITWVPIKAIALKALGYQAGAYLEAQYLDTGKALRDLIFIPSVAKLAFKAMIASHETADEVLEQKAPGDYLAVPHNKTVQQYSSYLHGIATVDVIKLQGIQELPAISDPSLLAIQASAAFKPGVMAINFGSPNVATFLTEEDNEGNVQTLKVDAKSLKREEMKFGSSKGKIQSGVFFVPTNLPEGALAAFKTAAEQLQGRKDLTCVNTNCRVLKEAGFSIEGVEMEDVIFPTTMMEHLLYRKVFYKDPNDQEAKKYEVHFDVINTTEYELQEYIQRIDTAVVGTRLRHRRRDADTPEAKNSRAAELEELLKIQADRLAELGAQEIDENDPTLRTISVSVPTVLGDFIAEKLWGRHTIYEVDLSDVQNNIQNAFTRLATLEDEKLKLTPFPQTAPSVSTRIKRDLAFSKPIIRLLRRHMMGSVKKIRCNTQDLFSHFKSDKEGEVKRVNYVLFKGKVVLAKINPNPPESAAIARVADWALCKHALLADRSKVLCSGELWYDEEQDTYMLNNDSGTYTPSRERVELAAELARAVFGLNFKVSINDHEEKVG